MKYVKIFFVFIGVWFAASLINGVLSGICILMGAPGAYGNGTIGLALIFSFIFSIPLVAAVWLVTAIAQLAGAQGMELFRVVVIASLVCATAGAIFFVSSFKHDFNDAAYAAGCCIILSAITAVTIFRNSIKGHESTV